MDILPGIIWSVACGLAVGNYACSLVHRLPRGESLTFNLDTCTVKKPYCGSCGNMLATRDLFPVLSYLINRGQCRFCGAGIPVTHLITELLCGFLFALAYIKYGFGEPFILLIITGVLLITLASIEVLHHYLPRSLLTSLMVVGLVYRVLKDGSIYGAAQGSIIGLMLGIILWRLESLRTKEQSRIPADTWLWVIAGLYFSPLYFMLFAWLFSVMAVVSAQFTKGRPIFYGIPFSIALLLVITEGDWLLKLIS